MIHEIKGSTEVNMQLIIDTDLKLIVASSHHCNFTPRKETAGVSVRQPRQCSAGHGYGRCRASLRPRPALVQCLGPYLV